MRKAFVFDFDDTLASTANKVYVRDSYFGLVLDELTPFEYSQYKLNEGEEFDFTDFRTVKNPIPTFLLALAKEVADEGHHVYILTARSSAAESCIDSFLTEHGITYTHIHCVGNDADCIARAKSNILFAIMREYTQVYYYDDDAANVHAAPEGIKKYVV
jgi:hypothetical protein